MKKSRYTDSQIVSILKQAEAGTPVPALCREHCMSGATFYKWRSRYGGMDASLMTRLKELEDENRRLKKMYAEERLKAEIVTEALAKKWSGSLNTVRGPSRRSRTQASAYGWRVRPFASVKPVTGIRQRPHTRTSRSPTGCCD